MFNVKDARINKGFAIVAVTDLQELCILLARWIIQSVDRALVQGLYSIETLSSHIPCHNVKRKP